MLPWRLLISVECNCTGCLPQRASAGGSNFAQIEPSVDCYVFAARRVPRLFISSWIPYSEKQLPQRFLNISQTAHRNDLLHSHALRNLEFVQEVRATLQGVMGILTCTQGNNQNILATAEACLRWRRRRVHAQENTDGRDGSGGGGVHKPCRRT